VALVFFLTAVRFTYLKFPKYIDTLKESKEIEISVLEREFFVPGGRKNNTWILEIEFYERTRPGIVFRVSINGTPLEAARTRGRRLLLELPSSLIEEGKNSVTIGGDAGWAFKTLRIKDIFGYSSGFLSGVIFPKHNVYPDIRIWPRSALDLLLLILLTVLAFVLNLFPEARTRAAPPFLRALQKTRYVVPGLFLGLILLPLFSRYRAAIELASLGRLVAVFFALAYVFELKVILSRAVRRTPFLVRLRDGAKTELLVLWKKGQLLPAILLFCFIFLVLVYPGPRTRLGDGLEYCAMLVSWAEYFTPYVTEESCARLEQRMGRISGPERQNFFSWMKRSFPSLLKNGRELDLPHFWFYSLAAAVFYWPVRLSSQDIGLCFMLLHIVLLLAAFFIIKRKLGQAAGLSFFFIIYASPLLWFINKVHVEFFTVMLTLIGITLFVTEDLAASALSFAVASTQNPPFAVLCVLVFIFGFWRKKGALVRGRGLIIWSGSFLLACLHPAYYYFRLRMLNPIVGTKSIGIGSDLVSLKKMLCFIVDPDIGLLVNWILALPLLFVFAFLALRKQTHLTLRTGLFLLFSVLVLLWSQSRTSNWNHGGTYYISRYALWYLYVFFLLAWETGLYFSRRKKDVKRAFVGAVICVGLIEAVIYLPNRPETYLRPTRASRLIYGRCPGLYDPMPEIFIERYRGQEKDLPYGVWAVSNPSGSKILVNRIRMKSYLKEEEIPSIVTCPWLDPVLVYREAKERFVRTPRRDHIYINGMGKKLTRAKIDQKRER